MITVNTGTLSGIEGKKVHVEVEIVNGIPSFVVIGLGDTTIKEAGERIKGAIINSGFRYPKGRVIVNLSPANLRKKGSHMELAVAVGMLGVSGQIDISLLDTLAFFGELSLSGQVLPVKGVLPMAKELEAEEDGKKIDTIIIPAANRHEAHLIGQKTVCVKNIKEVIEYINDKTVPIIPKRVYRNSKAVNFDYSEIKGQAQAKEALTIAAAGNHGLVMIGSPGTGKTMLAQRITTILPPMTRDEIVESAVIYSALGKRSESITVEGSRPFRIPYYRVSIASLIGGGAAPVPGEISLANNGVLFLDEIGEFQRPVLDSLRVPLVEKEVILSRRGEHYRFPADFLLIAASNPCKCGYYGDTNRQCTCTQNDIDNYRRKISGPLADRIDLHIYVPNIDYKTFQEKTTISSEEMREKVEKARQIQYVRYRGTGVKYNSQLSGEEIRFFCHMTKDAKYLLEMAYDKMMLNPRTCEKIIKVSQTIADVQGSDSISEEHIGQALAYRDIDKIYGVR